MINRTDVALNEGYIISVLGIDVKAFPRLTWLQLYKNEIMMDEKVAMVGDIYRYSNQTNKILYGEVSAIFAGSTNDAVQLKNVTQYSESNGNILINGSTYTIVIGGSTIPIPTPTTTPNPTYGSYETYGTIASETEIAGGINLSTLPVIWTPQSLTGFYYDLNSNIGKEELTIKNIDVSGRNIPLDGLYYNTSAQLRMLNVVKEVFGGNVTAAQAKGLKRANTGEAFEGGNYQVVGWQGEKYVAFNRKVNKLAKLVLEHGPSSTEKKTLTVGQTWDIGNGWTLTARSIDAKATPRQTWLILGKDGVKKEDIFLTQGFIYTYVEKSIFNESEVPLFITYLDSVFAGATSDMVQFKYTWILSPDVTTIQNGETLGTLKVESLTPNLILRNTDSIITLPKGSIVDMTDKLQFKVADSDTLGFIPVAVHTTQGTTYEKRGTAWNETSINGFGGTGNITEWNASNFEGFFYDIDNNIGNESLRMLQTNLNKNQRIIGLNNLAYNTKAEPKILNVVKKAFYGNVTAAAAAGLERIGTGQAFENGRYYIMGWQGNRSVALNGRVDKISKLILEQSTDAENKTLSVGENWSIGEGWVLKAQTIDATVFPKQVRLVLSKDGVENDDKIIAMGKIYSYVENTSAGDYIPFFVTYIDNIFTDVTTDKVKLKYTWAISSNITTIQSGDKFGIFTVVDLDIANKYLGLKNRDATITLTSGATVGLEGNMKFKVADSDSLRYYPFLTKTVTVPEMRGDVNKNGVRDTGDATLLLSYIAELPIPAEYMPILPIGDMNCNGMIDTGDGTLVLRDVVGLDIPRCWE